MNIIINKPIKILYVIDSYSNPNAGTEGQLFQLIKHLDRKLFEPMLLVLMPSSWLSTNDFPCPVEVLGHNSIKSPATWFALIKKAKQYKNEDIQLAHVFFNDASVICPPVFKLIGIKTFISRRDMGYWYTALYKLLLPITGRLICGVIVNSNAVGEVTQQVERIPHSKIHTIYNGFDQTTELLLPISELEYFKQQSILFVIVANIRPIKRMQDAIIALSRLKQYDAKLVIIGGGDNPSQLKSLAAQLNISEKILFLGARSDIKYCLQYADIGLLCSESEGFSNAIVEYQFAKLPVICSSVGGNPEAITDNENGYLYTAGNVDELTIKMQYLLEAPELIKKLGNTGYSKAKNQYTIPTMISAHHKLYTDTIVGGNSLPDCRG